MAITNNNLIFQEKIYFLVHGFGLGTTLFTADFAYLFFSNRIELQLLRESNSVQNN